MTALSNSDRLTRTLAAIDEANRQDPRTDYDEDSTPFPSELLYAQRMSDMLHSFRLNPSEALQLAARSQHIERWKIPRDQYPMNRKGYLQWRSQLKQFHGARAGEIMKAQGYGEDTIVRVKDLLNKKQLKRDDEVQTLENVVCLVFLRYYFVDFTEKHPEEKVIDIVTKTWKKMSPNGQQAAQSLPLSSKSRAIIEKALS